MKWNQREAGRKVKTEGERTTHLYNFPKEIAAYPQHKELVHCTIGQAKILLKVTPFLKKKHLM